MKQTSALPGTFRSPFSKGYWQAAAAELKTTRRLILAALFVALTIAVGRIFIPVPIPAVGDQRVYFTFLVGSVGCTIYGPVVGVLVGAVADVIGALLFPTGPFFPGYTLTAMIGPLLYGLFFYKARLSVLRIAVCKLLVNVIANIVCNSLWASILGGNDFFLLMITRAPKNLILLPAEVLLMVVFFRAMVPVLRQMRLIEHTPFEGNIPWV